MEKAHEPRADAAHSGEWSVYTQEEGMSLRDWYAGQALAGMMSHKYHDCTPEVAEVAKVAYRLADAMLKAREEVARG